ncbi:insulinase family protein [Pleionea litopenaei]|uniref:Protease 3 n=1 Tax=Pleionea litopenaei TaxID=3070815 RepID=A0AA51RQ49_9GAMM|nr:insulinase family protein [Pleionea sp. HL-JVS1]WMS85563.1 insulinase family protein [Pleionea sp. HL-JVS1]
MTKTFKLSYLLIAATLSAATLQPAFASKVAPQPVIASPADTRSYEAMTLKNGITVMLVSDPSVDKSAAALSVGVGLLQDPMTQQGMAHYLEHMLFMGTERFPDPKGYNEFMSNHGGSSNAYTWLDITNYMFEVNNDAYDEALDRFSDFFKTPKLYPEYTDKEKNAVNAEWSMRREMDFFGMFKLSRSMMGEHPANRFLIGNLETLSDKEHAKLHPQTVEFYNKYYSANIMKVALVSNLPLAEMRKMAEKHFSTIKNKKIDKPKVTAKIDFKALGGKRIHYVPNTDIKQLMIDFTIENNSDDYAVKPNQYLSYIIGSEMPGTPAYILKKAGLISSLGTDASPSQYGNYGQFSITAELTDEGMKHREKITQVIMAYIDKVKKQGVDKKYFKEIKTSLNNQFQFLEKGSAFNYVSNLTAQMQNYPTHRVIAAPYVYDTFSADAINKVLQQLTPERLRIWYVSQSEPSDQSMHFYDGKYKITDIPAKEIASWSSKPDFELALPKVNTLLPESFVLKTTDLGDMTKPTVVHDKDGIKVWQYPSQQFKQQPKGVLRVYINSPLRQKDINGQVLFSLWADMYDLNQSALMTEASIAGMQLNLQPANGLELSVSGFTDKQPELLKKGLDSLVFDVKADAFNQAVDRYVRGLKNQEKQFPIYQLFGNMRSLIASSGYSNDDLVKAAQALKPADLKEFMQQVMANNQIRMFAFGNYNKRDIEHYVEQVAESLPENHKVTNYVQTRYWKPSEGEVLALKKDLDVSDVAVLDMHVHPEPNLKHQAEARVLQSHLRTQTFETLRTEEQLAYAVTAITPTIKDFVGVGFAIQTPVKDVEAMQNRFDSFKQEYAKVLDKMTADEFNKLKESVLIELKEAPKNLGEEQAPMLSDWYEEKFDFNTREQLIAEVEKVTLADVKNFYQQTALNPKAARLSIQLRGQKFNEKPFAKLKNEKTVDDLAKFHSDADYQ